ncbi:hypothetical protein Ddc_23634 [Ditylenchus destructor]|nr:hypothetical protein Ddc_23634 [Ditylenchus destructor]
MGSTISTSLKNETVGTLMFITETPGPGASHPLNLLICNCLSESITEIETVDHPGMDINGMPILSLYRNGPKALLTQASALSVLLCAAPVID